MTTLSTQRTVDADHPWLGLTPYTENTKEYFFGRDEEVRELFVRVREQPLTILFGQSGLGKTSLLGAGLIPKLRVEGFRPTLLRLGYEAGDLPLMEQARFTFSHSTNTQSESLSPAARSSTLWEQFHQISTRRADLQSSPPVLIFDQFEEIFTLATSKERQAEANELFRQLADLIENRPPQAVQDRMRSDRRSAREYDLGPSPVRIVFTLREDFLSHLEAYKNLMPSLMRNRMAIHMLNGPQALEAVVRPGRIQGRNLVSDEVGARIVRFVADQPPETPLEEIGAVPPLLSLLCDELNQLRIAQHQPMIGSDKDSLSGLESLGRNILDEFYARSFAGLHSAVRDYIEDRMVTVGGHRNPIAFEDALADLESFGVEGPSAAINQLIQGRLLSIEDRNGVQRLEITHDVLAPLVVRSRDERRGRQRGKMEEQSLNSAYLAHADLQKHPRQHRRVTIALGLAMILLIGVTTMRWYLFQEEIIVNAALPVPDMRSVVSDLRAKNEELAWSWKMEQGLWKKEQELLSKSSQMIREAVGGNDEVQDNLGTLLEPYATVDAKNLALSSIMLSRGENYLNTVESYSTRLEKQERFAGKLSEVEVIDMKVRQSPSYAVYLKWETVDRGRQILYNDDYDDEMMVVKLGGLKGRSIPAIKINPFSAMAMSDARYPIPDTGLLPLAKRIQTMCGRPPDETAPIRCQRGADIERDLESCAVFTIEFPSREQSPQIQTIEVTLEKDRGIPVSYRAYAWKSENETQDELLLESYSFSDIDFAQTFVADDFLRENPAYRF